MDNFICLITGPAGAGKSTIAELLCKQYPKTARVNVDDIRWCIRNGRVKPFPPTDEAKKQIELSSLNGCSLAKNYIKYRFNVFIDDVVISKDKLDFYFQELKDYKFFVFLLLPSQEVVKFRDGLRPSDEIMGERALELHQKFNKRIEETRWNIIDSSNQTPEETLKAVMDKLPQ